MKTDPPRASFRYRCVHCGKIVLREADKTPPKQWIRSYCAATGKNVRLQHVPDCPQCGREGRLRRSKGIEADDICWQCLNTYSKATNKS